MRKEKGEKTYTAIFRSSTAVAVAVEARHGRLGEEGEGLAEDFLCYVQERISLIAWSRGRMAVKGRIANSSIYPKPQRHTVQIMITRFRRHGCCLRFVAVKVSELKGNEKGEEDGDAEGEDEFDGCPPGGLLHLLIRGRSGWRREGRWGVVRNTLCIYGGMGELYHDDITSPSGFGNADKGVEDG